jgi:hypothetical protein
MWSGWNIPTMEIWSWIQPGSKAFYLAHALANKASMTCAALSSVFAEQVAVNAQRGRGAARAQRPADRQQIEPGRDQA